MDIDRSLEETVELSEEKEALLRQYTELLAAYSSGKVRLTGAKDTEVLWNEHIMDCLYSVSLLPDEGTVIDVGTGGGLPGIVWAICRPDLQFTLIDSLEKKTDALEEIVNELKLSNVEVICTRSEDLAMERRETFTVASARAVSRSGILAEYLSPLVKVGGYILAMKGPAYKEEIHSIRKRWGEFGLEVPEVYKYRLHGLHEKKGYVLKWNKITECAEKYPRRPGRAEKKPWWERKK